MKRSAKRKAVKAKRATPVLAPGLLFNRIDKLGDCFITSARVIRQTNERVAALEQNITILSARLDATADYLLPRVAALQKRASKAAAVETAPAAKPSINKRKVQKG